MTNTPTLTKHFRKTLARIGLSRAVVAQEMGYSEAALELYANRANPSLAAAAALREWIEHYSSELANLAKKLPRDNKKR